MHGQSSAAQPQPTVTMMKTFSLAALVASAFAPSQQVSRSSSSALAAKAFADEIGAQMPVSYVAHKTISR